MNNRKLGNSFEAELCDILFDHGFWAHNLAQNQAGQPADVIAARNGVPYLIDCKVCSGKGFPLSRVEENQDLAMCLWRDSGNDVGWFAIKSNGEIFMVPHDIIVELMRVKSVMSHSDIEHYGEPLDLWISQQR